MEYMIIFSNNIKFKIEIAIDIFKEKKIRKL